MVHSIEYSQTLKLLTLASALLIGACSSSSDSTPTVDPTTIDADQNDTSVTVDSNQNNESLTADSNQIDASPIVADPTTTNPITPSLVRVDFEINVPAYVSNSLKVDLAWGEQAIPVQWVGDELWSASGDLLSNTENLLIVTFFDDNGAITLGKVETSFKTGLNSVQSLQISAEQFDTSAWDSDNDGISNLDESIAGTNPLLDESALLEVRESLDFSVIGIYSINSYEARIPEQRPYFEHKDESANCCSTSIATIDIDESGTGSYFTESVHTVSFDTTTSRQTGTRTTTDNSITWDGTSYWYNSGAAVGNNSEFNYTTTLLEGSQRSIVGSIQINSQGRSDPDDSYIEFSLFGDVIEGTQRCAPVSGTVSREYYRRRNSDGNTIITASKATSDRYWRVDSIIRNWNESIEEAYFVNDIGTTFQCNFTDWE